MIRRYPGQSLMLAILVAFVFCLTAHAQLNNATIRGTVTDSKGAVLQNATVVLVNEGTAEQTTQPTNKDGYYTFPALGPANYTVKVDVPGFNEWEVKLTLRVAQEAVIDAKLVPGAVKTVITVTDATPAIDTADPTLSDVKTETQISTIPVFSSNFLNILNFSPGVVANSYAGAGGGYTRVNGIPGGSITFQVDGESMNDRFTNELQTTPQALQTIQELKVTTSNGSAEYSTPGVVDVVTKSGTNQFHGQVHELYQTGGLEAWAFNQHSPGAHHPHLVHNEFGGQLGGPVRIPGLYNGRNKTFFYFDVEKQLDHRLLQDQEVVPETPWLSGDFSDLLDAGAGQGAGPGGTNIAVPVTLYDPLSGVYNPATGVVTRTPFANNDLSGRISAVAQQVAKYLPRPNVNVDSTGKAASVSDFDNQFYFNGYNWINPLSTKDDPIIRYSGKVDQLFGKNLLSARYTYTSENEITLYGGNDSYNLLGTTELESHGGHNGVLSYTTPIGSSAVNEARVGIQLYGNTTGPVPQPGITAALGLPLEPGNVTWPGLYYLPRGNVDNGGTDVNTWPAWVDRDNPKLQPNQNITLGDNYSWTRGKHEMKFGFQVTNFRVNTQEDQSPGGDYNFDGAVTGLQDPSTSLNARTADILPHTGFQFADMLLGYASSTQFNIIPVFHTRQTYYDGFATDNFKMNPRLTLNLGVRYDYWSPFTDAGGLSSTMDFNHTAPCVIPTSLNSSGTPFDCVTPGTTGYPAWFGQSSPYVVIPDSGAGQKQPQYAAALAAYEAAGLPVETASQAGISSSLWNMQKNDWAPRLGFAYQLNDKTVLRGGYGIYYWTMPLVQYHQATRDNVPWDDIVYNYTDNSNIQAALVGFPYGPSNAGGGPGYSNQCAPTGACRLWGAQNDMLRASFTEPISNTGGFGMTAWDPNFKAQHAQEWNVTVERTLPGDWAAKVSYVGNHGGNLIDTDSFNAVLPRALNPNNGIGTTFTGDPYPIYTSASTSSYGNEIRFIGYSNHNEVRGEINHTFRGSFILQSYFTYGRSLGTSEGTADANSSLELPPAVLTNNASTVQRLRDIYAPDSYIPEKTFVINGHYELPFGKGKPFLAASNTTVNEVVSGWNATLFYMWHSGFYFSPFYNANPGIGNGGNDLILASGALHPGGVLPEGERTRSKWFDASVWDPALGYAYAGQTYEKRDVNFDLDYLNGIPRNYMTGPGYSNADGTLYKLTPIGKHMKVDLEMQVFNVFNHANLGLPGSGGTITKPLPITTNPPRLLQFQSKLIF